MFNEKPCPFCGSHQQELSLSTPDREGTPVAMCCTDCGALGPWIYVASSSTPGAMMIEASKEWDRRASERTGAGT
jgi:Lar family restriction alleviation protein